MVSSSTFLITLASLAAAAQASPLTKVVRGGGYPASNPPGVTCYNTWETVTNDVCALSPLPCPLLPLPSHCLPSLIPYLRLFTNPPP